MAIDKDQLLLVAIELLRRQIADLPLAMGMNRDPATEPVAPNTSRSVADAEASAKMGSLDYTAGGTGGNAIPGSRASPLPIPPPPSAPLPLPPHEPGRRERVADGANAAAVASLKPLSSASAALGRQFGAMLGPLGQLSTYMTSAGSGFQLVQGAMGLFASTIGTVIQPAAFVLSTGLTAASQRIARELMPSMDKFTKWVLSTGLPAMQSFADAVGKATKAIAWLADSKLGSLAAAGDNRGGTLGATNRVFDRLAGNGETGEVKRDKNATGWDAAVGWMKSAHRGLDDATTSVGGRMGGQAVDAKNWALKKAHGAIWGKDRESDVDAYSGMGTKKTGDKSMEDTLKAARLNISERQFQLGARGGVGDVRGNWARAQNSLSAMSPFQQEQLRLAREQLGKDIEALRALEEVARNTSGGGAAPADPYRGPAMSPEAWWRGG